MVHGEHRGFIARMSPVRSAPAVARPAVPRPRVPRPAIPGPRVAQTSCSRTTSCRTTSSPTSCCPTSCSRTTSCPTTSCQTTSSPTSCCRTSEFPDHELPRPAVARPRVPDQLLPDHGSQTSCSRTTSCPTSCCRTTSSRPAVARPRVPDQLLPDHELPDQLFPDHELPDPRPVVDRGGRGGGRPEPTSRATGARSATSEPRARVRSMRPAPEPAGAPTSGCAVPVRSALMASGPRSGRAWRSSATAPLTTAVDCDVPVPLTRCSPTRDAGCSRGPDAPGATRLTIDRPGATTSGWRTASPRLE